MPKDLTNPDPAPGKRPNTYPGIFKRFSTWSAIVSYRDAQGHRKQSWKGGFATQKEARKWQIEQEASRNEGADISPSALTVKGWLERWLANYAAGLGETTSKTYATNLRVHVIPAIGDKLLRELRPVDLDDVYRAIVRKGRSPKTALNVHRVMREALSHAVKLELVSRNVADAVQAPRAVKHNITPPTLEQLETIRAAAAETQYGALVELALFTGMRQGELIALRWTEVDLDAGQLRVSKAKWNSAGVISLGSDAVALLRAHRRAQAEQALAAGPNWSRSGFVFTSQIGTQIDAGGLKRTWARLKRQTGLDTRFHDLRHAHASLLIAANVHPKVLQERLRHRNISTTLDVYGHLMPGLQEEAARLIDVALRRQA